MTRLTIQQLKEKVPKFIAVEGPLGGGKTELAQHLAETLSYNKLIENACENPFIEAFFKHNSSKALANHLFFLLQRCQITAEFNQDDVSEPMRITDFIIEKDYFLAKTFLVPEEFAIYNRIYELITLEMPKPELVIYLQTPTTAIQRYLESHPYANLQSVNPFFLEQVNNAYRNFFHYYDSSPLLIVNAENVDLIDDNNAFDALIECLTETHSGRHYFNPITI